MRTTKINHGQGSEPGICTVHLYEDGKQVFIGDKNDRLPRTPYITEAKIWSNNFIDNGVLPPLKPLSKFKVEKAKFKVNNNFEIIQETEEKIKIVEED